MDLLGALTDVGKSVVNTAMAPLDLVLDILDPRDSYRFDDRIDNVVENMKDAYDKVTDK